jgi:solute carrier family 25 (mitochondrial oxoglutarate transporter), member 11
MSLSRYAAPPPPHGSAELHAYITLLEDEIERLGGALPAHRPDVLGPPRLGVDSRHHRNKSKSVWKSFVAGGVAAMVGGSVVHPIDVIKVRQQLFGMKDGFGVGSSWVARARTTSFAATASALLKEEGAAGLFRGVTAGLLRQAAFVGTKFVLYEQLKQRAADGNGELAFSARVGCGLAAGTGGALVGNPFDLAMVRMQADGKLPLDMQRGYNNGLEAIARIVREEGAGTLWRGCQATVARGAIITASQFAIYDQAKYDLARFGLVRDGPANSVAASLVASVASGIASNPVDVAKGRLFYMQRRTKDGQWPYKGMVDCMFKTAKQEGVVALWRGLGATIARQMPLNAIRFLIMEQMTVLLRN